MSRTTVRTTAPSTVRGRLARGLAAAGIVALAMMPTGALAGTIGDQGGTDTQRIEGICEIAPRLPYLCYNR